MKNLILSIIVTLASLFGGPIVTLTNMRVLSYNYSTSQYVKKTVKIEYQIYESEADFLLISYIDKGDTYTKSFPYNTGYFNNCIDKYYKWVKVSKENNLKAADKEIDIIQYCSTEKNGAFGYASSFLHLYFVIKKKQNKLTYQLKLVLGEFMDKNTGETINLNDIIFDETNMKQLKNVVSKKNVLEKSKDIKKAEDILK